MKNEKEIAHKMIRVGFLKVPKDRLRKIDKKKVKELAESIKNSGGLLNPITVAGDTLVAGLHRYEAAKLLGLEFVPVCTMGDKDNADQCRLMEIDENLVRNELSPSERAEHIAVKTEILSRRYSAASPRNPTDLVGKRGKITDEENESRNKRAIETAANKKAKEDVAAQLGPSASTHVIAAIKDHEAVKDAKIDDSTLIELNASDFKAVAKTARKDPKQAKEQAKEIVKARANGDNKSAKLLKSDQSEYLLREIQRFAEIKTTAKKFAGLVDDKYLSRKLEDYILESDEIATLLKKRLAGLSKNHLKLAGRSKN